jgi:hypothetical protein
VAIQRGYFVVTGDVQCIAGRRRGKRALLVSKIAIIEYGFKV